MLNFLRTVKCTSWCIEGKVVSVVLGSSLRNLNAHNSQWDSFQTEHKLPVFWQATGRCKFFFGGKCRPNYKIQIL